MAGRQRLPERQGPYFSLEGWRISPSLREGCTPPRLSSEEGWHVPVGRGQSISTAVAGCRAVEECREITPGGASTERRLDAACSRLAWPVECVFRSFCRAQRMCD